MAEVVIKIPDNMDFRNYDIPYDILNIITNGKQLPKGHGRLKDTDKISDIIKHLRNGWNRYGNEYESGKYEAYDYALDEIMDAPTIIKADRGDEE